MSGEQSPLKHDQCVDAEFVNLRGAPEARLPRARHPEVASRKSAAVWDVSQPSHADRVSRSPSHKYRSLPSNWKAGDQAVVLSDRRQVQRVDGKRQRWRCEPPRLFKVYSSPMGNCDESCLGFASEWRPCELCDVPRMCSAHTGDEVVAPAQGVVSVCLCVCVTVTMMQ